MPDIKNKGSLTHEEFLKMKDGILFNSQLHNQRIQAQEKKRINRIADQEHKEEETLKKVVAERKQFMKE